MVSDKRIQIWKERAARGDAHSINRLQENGLWPINIAAPKIETPIINQPNLSTDVTRVNNKKESTAVLSFRISIPNKVKIHEKLSEYHKLKTFNDYPLGKRNKSIYLIDALLAGLDQIIEKAKPEYEKVISDRTKSKTEYDMARFGL